MEKVISEWKVVETDDGFRVEVKGDKEAMRNWIHRAGPWRGMRRAMRFGVGGAPVHGGRHGFGHCCGTETDEPAEGEQE